LQIDASALPPAVGGHIAMIQSALVAKDDPREALQLLDKARVMLPGTVVEEEPCAAGLFSRKKFPTSTSSRLSRANIFGVSKILSISRAFASSSPWLSSILASPQIQATGLDRKTDQQTRTRKPAPALFANWLSGYHYRGIISGKAGAALMAAAKAEQSSQDGTPEQARAALYGQRANIDRAI
jgi:chemotaxis protein MotC